MDRIAGAPPLADYSKGQHVMTKEGFPGVIADILEGPADVTYFVTLDNHMGGGEYDEGEIWPLTDRTSAATAVEHTAFDDYPELGTILEDRPPLQITTHAAVAEYVVPYDDDYDNDDLNYPMYSGATPEWWAADRAGREKREQAQQDAYDALPWWKKVTTPKPVTQDERNRSRTRLPPGFALNEAAAKIALTLPLEPQEDPQKGETPQEQQGYSDGVVDGRAGVTRNFRGELDPNYRAGYDRGWAFGVQQTRAPVINDLAEEQEIEDEQVLMGDPIIASLDQLRTSIHKDAGMIWDVIKGDPSNVRGYLTYDWCRYRRDGHCYYSKNLNVEASKEAGYAVWVPEDRGNCFRQKWAAQQECPMAMPGPHVPGGFTNATIPYENGGQRGGHPTTTYRSSLIRQADLEPSFAFMLTASWRDVQKKATRIRTDGGVRLLAARNGTFVAHVRGDTNVYETEIVNLPGKHTVGSWNCGCKWAAYSWGRSGPWKKYEGRMCSHALALSYEIQSRGSHGREVTLDESQPSWMNPTIPVRTPNTYDRDKGRYSSLRLVEEQDDTAPMVMVVAGMLSEGIRYGDIREFAKTAGVQNVPGLVKEARKVAPFAAKVWGIIRSLFIDDDGQIKDEETKDVYAPKDVMFPDWDPVKGLDYRPPPGERTAVLHTASPADDLGRAKTLEEAVDALVAYAREEEPRCTNEMKTVAREERGELEGLDNRFKTKGSLLRKMSAESGGRSPAQTAMGMSDSLRYTMLLPASTYTEGVKDATSRLERDGYGTRVKNYWLRGDAYNGINVALTTPDGFPVELQFHTQASIQAKLKSVHALYEQWRVSKDPFQRVDLAQKMRNAYDKVPMPPDVLSIPGKKFQSPGLWDFPPKAAARKELSSDYRYVITDSGWLVRFPADDSSSEVWLNGEWIHHPEFGRYNFLGEPSEPISEEEANAYCMQGLVEPSYDFSSFTFVPVHAPVQGAIFHDLVQHHDQMQQAHHELQHEDDEFTVQQGNATNRLKQDNDKDLQQRHLTTPVEQYRAETLGGLWADLHDDPEPALPTTDGADDDKQTWSGYAGDPEPDDEDSNYFLRADASSNGLVTIPDSVRGNGDSRTYKAAEADVQHRFLTEDDVRSAAAGQIALSLAVVDPTTGASMSFTDWLGSATGTAVEGPTTDAEAMAMGMQDDVSEAREDLGLAPLDTSLGASLEVPAEAGEVDRGREIVAQLDEWKRLVEAGVTPGFDHPFAHLGGGAPSADDDIVAAAQQFASKTALKTYSPTEKQAIIGEGEDGEGASNFDRMDISGTHYEALEVAQAQRSASPDLPDDMWLLDGDPNG